MSVAHIKLRNRNDEYAIVDQFVLEEIESNEYLSSIRFLKMLRSHSNGYAIFQRCVSSTGLPVFETIYLHRYIAEKYVKKPKHLEGRLLVRFKNGNVRDCRIENLDWTTMGLLRRVTAPTTISASGYRGVVKERNRFKAMIYVDKKPVVIGYYSTAEEAARAYNAKSIELFGDSGTLNPLD